MAADDKLYWTGDYAVAHFGTPDNPTQRPLFLIAEGKGEPRKFTNNLERAARYSTRTSAEMAKNEENFYLEQDNHPLNGRLSVVAIYVMKEPMQ